MYCDRNHGQFDIAVIGPYCSESMPSKKVLILILSRGKRKKSKERKGRADRKSKRERKKKERKERKRKKESDRKKE